MRADRLNPGDQFILRLKPAAKRNKAVNERQYVRVREVPKFKNGKDHVAIRAIRLGQVGRRVMYIPSGTDVQVVLGGGGQ